MQEVTGCLEAHAGDQKRRLCSGSEKKPVWSHNCARHVFAGSKPACRGLIVIWGPLVSTACADVVKRVSNQTHSHLTHFVVSGVLELLQHVVRPDRLRPVFPKEIRFRITGETSAESLELNCTSDLGSLSPPVSLPDAFFFCTVVCEKLFLIWHVQIFLPTPAPKKPNHVC